METKLPSAMKTRVYHDLDFNPLESRQRFFPSDYVLVAEVETNSKDVAFERTNSIDCAWFDNEGVIVHEKARSTSMGDVVVLPNGEAHLCEMLGWSLIGQWGACEKNPVAVITGFGVGKK